VRLLVLTEDSAKSASRVVELLFKRLVTATIPGANISQLDPRPISPELTRIMRANNWRSAQKEHRQDIVRLCNAIKVFIADPSSFVVFHHDADLPWRNRHNRGLREQFQKCVFNTVKMMMEQDRRTPAFVQEALSRVIHLVPHYSIEAWLYQNIDEARKLGATEPQLNDWQQDRGLLDELEKTPEQLPSLKRSANERLAETFNNATMRVAIRAGKSLFYEAWKISSNSQLKAALAKTAAR